MLRSRRLLAALAIAPYAATLFRSAREPLSMNLVACIKRVPDTATKVRVGPDVVFTD